MDSPTTRRSAQTNVARFLKAFENHARKLIESDPKGRNENIIERVSEQIFEPWTHEQEKPLESKQTTFLRDYFNDFWEVMLACEQLDTLSDLIRNTISDKDKYHLPTVITYWSEAYLNEVYVFDQRIGDFLTATERRYKQDPTFGVPIHQICEGLQETINKQLSSIIKIRGSHVHRARSRHNDPQLTKLAHLELLVTGLGNANLIEERDKAIAEAQKWLQDQVDYFSNVSWTIFDSTCCVLAEGIVTENGWLIVPANHKDRPLPP